MSVSVTLLVGIISLCLQPQHYQQRLLDCPTWIYKVVYRPVSGANFNHIVDVIIQTRLFQLKHEVSNFNWHSWNPIIISLLEHWVNPIKGLIQPLLFCLLSEKMIFQPYILPCSGLTKNLHPIKPNNTTSFTQFLFILNKPRKIQNTTHNLFSPFFSQRPNKKPTHFPHYTESRKWHTISNEFWIRNSVIYQLIKQHDWTTICCKAPQNFQNN